MNRIAVILWACRPTEEHEGAGGARTTACRVHTRVNACAGSKGVRKIANTARQSACATRTVNPQ